MAHKEDSQTSDYHSDVTTTKVTTSITNKTISTLHQTVITEIIKWEVEMLIEVAVDKCLEEVITTIQVITTTTVDQEAADKTVVVEDIAKAIIHNQKIEREMMFKIQTI